MTDISGYNVSSIESLIYVRDQTGNRRRPAFICRNFNCIIRSSHGCSNVHFFNNRRYLTQNPELGVKGLFFSGMRVGKDMMGTMSNTLILAFAGGSINTLVFIYAYNYEYLQMINMFDIGIEIIQGVASSMGVILTVPICSLLAACVQGE